MAKINFEKHVYDLMNYQFVKGDIEDFADFIFIAG